MRLFNFMLVAACLLATAPISAETIAIIGGTVHTGGAIGTLENATVLIDDGQIIRVGTDLEIPEGATIIDAAGKIVTPGIMNAHSALGLVELGLEASTVDRASESEIGPAMDVVPAININTTLIPVARIEGVTRALVAPSPSDNVFAGMGAIIHLGNGNDPVIQEKSAMFAVLGQAGSAVAGGSRSGAWVKLTRALEDTALYMRNRRAFEEGRQRQNETPWVHMNALEPVINRDTPLVVRVHRASDILQALKLRDQFGVDLILLGVTEGWMVADEIAAADVPVIINPMENLPRGFERLGARLENAALLAEAGVTLVLGASLGSEPSDPHNARLLLQAAGTAVAYGLKWETALAAITSTPARLFGIDNSYGTLEPGMDADVVVWDGDPLDVTSSPDVVIIRGEIIALVSRQTRLRDRYMDLSDDERFAYRR